MAFTAFRDMKPFPQLMFSVFVILVCFLAFMIISVVATIPFLGFDALMNLSSINELTDPGTIKVLKYFQVVQAVGLFIVPPIILGRLFYGNISEYLFLNKSFTSASVLLVVVLVFVTAPFVNFVGEINSNMVFPEWLSGVEQWMKSSEEKAEEITRVFLKVDTYGGLFFNLFMIAFLPAIGEELLFRGVIQRIFTKMTYNHHWGIWITAILFSALHMQFYGFVPRMFLGVLFGYLLVWSGSIWLPIFAHFLNNGFAVITMFMIDKNMLSPGIDEVGTSSGSYYMAAISLGLIVVFMLMIKRQNTGTQLKLEIKN
ncbi:MAG: CPBP family intramembrane metalloprotease [Bacteroidetes bacterium]|nr:CPBP family intramembrane metalloprotease [Bacteroidota bacterium]